MNHLATLLQMKHRRTAVFLIPNDWVGFEPTIARPIGGYATTMVNLVIGYRLPRNPTYFASRRRRRESLLKLFDTL
jgi:hypothetical protein